MTATILTKDQQIEHAKRLVAAETQAEDDINRYGEMQKTARLTLVITAFEVGESFRELQKQPHRMSQREIAHACGCSQKYVGFRINLVRHHGPSLITDLLAQDKRVHNLSHYLAQVPVVVRKPKTKSVAFDAAEDEDENSTPDEGAPDTEDAVADEAPVDELDDEEVEAVLGAIESAMEADEQAEADDIRHAVYDTTKALEAIQALRSSIETLPDHVRHLLRPFVDEAKIRAEEEFEAMLLAIEVAEVNNTTK